MHDNNGQASDRPDDRGPGLERDEPAERQPKTLRGAVRRRILHFTPSWFSVNMGTGISSILLYNLPFQFTGLTIIADCIFGLNVLLLCIFLCMSIVRYIAWPQVFNTMLRHPQQSLFLGTFPMGLATVINMVVLACVPAWGLNWAILAWILWWVDAFISILTCFGLRFVMFAYHTQSIEKMNAVWLLPVVAPIVAASTGGTVASVLPESHARLTIVVSYILWGTGVPTAMLILTVYFYRLSVHKLPESSLIVSVFLPLGPFGQGAYGIMQLAKVTRSLALSDGLGWLIPNSDVTSSSSRSLSMADSLFAMSLVVALVMWGFGLFWLVIALLSIAKAQRFPFNMGWWGFTFPLGVYAVSTATLGEDLDSFAFRIIGTVFSLCVVALWLYIGIRTFIKAVDGTMYDDFRRALIVRFVAPCLGELGKQNIAPPRSCGKEGTA